jgi:hypothetical protein
MNSPDDDVAWICPDAGSRRVSMEWTYTKDWLEEMGFYSFPVVASPPSASDSLI